MSEGEAEEANEGQITNQWGVLFVGKEDFDLWTWHEPKIDINAISVAAAEVVMDDLVESAMHYESIIDGRFCLTLSLFDGSVRAHFGLLATVDKWLESTVQQSGPRRGKHDFRGEDKTRTEIMLADMEEACRKLREALGG
jgi:hypothetical protein